MKKLFLSIVSILTLFTIVSAQTPNVAWGKALFDSNLPDGALVDSTDATYTYIGGGPYFLENYNHSRAVVVDKWNNNIWAADYSWGIWDATTWTYTNKSQGQDFAITKSNSSGEDLWVKYFGSSQNDHPWGLATDSEGDILITGDFGDSLDADPGVNEALLISGAGLNDNGFIIKLDPNGNFVFGKVFSSTVYLRCYAIAIDASDNYYIVGNFQGLADFDPGAGVQYAISTGAQRLFVVKLDSQGNYLWHYVAISSGESTAVQCVVDDQGSVYSVGYFAEDIDFSSTGTDLRVNQGYHDAFVFKLDSDGNYNWARTYSTTEDEELSTIVFDGQDIIVGGFYNDSIDVNSTGISQMLYASDTQSGFIQRVDTTGVHLFASELGSGSGIPRKMTVTSDKKVFIIGSMRDSSILNLPTGPDTLIAADDDIFLVSIDANNDWQSAISWPANGSDDAYGITADLYDNILVAGFIEEEVDLDLDDSSEYNLIAEGIGNDAILFQLVTCTLYDTVSVIACASYESPSANYTWTSTGTYQDTIASVHGCDSIVVIDLIILTPSFQAIYVISCDSFASPSGIFTWYNSGTYTDTLTNIDGCDSILTITLVVNNSVIATDIITSCGPYTWIDGNTYSNSNTISTHTLTTSSGCDSIITLDLTILNSSTSVDLITACDSYTWINGVTYTQSNATATHTLTNSNGCDSIISLDFTLITFNTSVSIDGSSLVADLSSAVFQWLDCDNSMQLLAGETSQAYMPISNGDYAVEISSAGCTDTSACLTYMISLIDGYVQQSIAVYPNPVVENDVWVSLPTQTGLLNVALYNSLGQLCFQREYEGAQEIRLTVPQEPGIYLLLTTTKDGVVSMHKIIR